METNNLFKVAEIKLVYKTKVPAKSRPFIKRSEDAYSLLLDVWDKDTIELCEEFVVLFLNRASHVIGLFHVAKGGTGSVTVDIKCVIIAALKANAASMIIAHNHPSGSLKPSDSDIRLTRKIKEAGLLLDISLFDHVIVTVDGYYSFADEGVL